MKARDNSRKEDDVYVRHELNQTDKITAVRSRYLSKAPVQTHGFDTLSNLACIQTKNAVASPLPLSRQPIDANDIVQRRFDRSAFEMKPFKRRNTLVLYLDLVS